MITESDMDDVFQALAHQTRRRILDHLRAQPGLAVGELAQSFDVTRIAIMQHLRVLEQAGLVISEREGRSRKLYLNAVPLQQIHERWTDEFSGNLASRLTFIKRAAELAVKKET